MRSHTWSHATSPHAARDPAAPAIASPPPLRPHPTAAGRALSAVELRTADITLSTAAGVVRSDGASAARARTELARAAAALHRERGDAAAARAKLDSFGDDRSALKARLRDLQAALSRATLERERNALAAASERALWGGEVLAMAETVSFLPAPAAGGDAPAARRLHPPEPARCAGAYGASALHNAAWGVQGVPGVPLGVHGSFERHHAQLPAATAADGGPASGGGGAARRSSMGSSGSQGATSANVSGSSACSRLTARNWFGPVSPERARGGGGAGPPPLGGWLAHAEAPARTPYRPSAAGDRLGAYRATGDMRQQLEPVEALGAATGGHAQRRPGHMPTALPMRSASVSSPAGDGQQRHAASSSM